MTPQGVFGRLAAALVVTLVAGGVLTGLVAALADPQMAAGGAFVLALVVAAVRYGGTHAGTTKSVYW
jgi:hypothetical protein